MGWTDQPVITLTPLLDVIMDAAAALGVPVMFHDGTPPYSTCRQIEWVAAKHPATQVIFAHAGLGDLWRDAADAGRLHDNIWLEPTAAPPVAIRAALDAVGPGRILFGSDGGFGTPDFVRYVIAKYRYALGQQLFEQVLLENPARLRRCAPGIEPEE